MTVTDTKPVSGPFTSDGVKTSFEFTFKIFDASQIALRITDLDGSNGYDETDSITVDPMYLDSDIGGYLVYTPAGNPLPAGKLIYPYRIVPYAQPNRIGNQGRFYPETHEQTFDLLEMQIQQIQEQGERAITIPIGADQTPDVGSTIIIAPDGNPFWGPVAGGGNMSSVVYDPQGVKESAFGWRSPFQKNIFKMELFGVRASQWPDYAAALALYGTTNFYTQWFCVDEDRDLAFYLRQPGADANNYGWMVVVEKFSTGAYQTCFRLGTSSRGPCWIEKIGGLTYFVSGYGTDLRGLGKWNVTTLPAALSTLAPAITVPPATTDNYVYGNNRNGITSLNSYTPSRGGARDLQQFKMFDASYNLIDTIDFPISVTSTLTEPGQDYFPHVQGYALGDNYHLFTYGARWRVDGSDGAVRVRKYAGTRVVSMDGKTVLAEGLIRPDFFIQKLQAKGVVCERLEGEGLWISRDGTAYALYVTRATSDGVSDGIVILKLFSQSDSAMDMSGGAVSAYSGPPERTGPTALVNRMVINRMTSVQFATLNDVLDHMLLLKLPYFSFTSGYDVGDMFVPGGFVDLNGQTFNALMRVEIYMLDAGEGGKFHMVTRGSGRGPRDWTIAGTSGSRTQSLQKRPNFKAKITGQTVTPGSDVLLAFDNAVRVAGSCYDASAGNYKFTPRDGLCSMGFAIQVDTGLVVSATVDLKIFKNGASWASYRHIVQATTGQSFVMPDVEDEAVLGDFYQAYVNFSGSGNKVIYTAELRSWFKGHNFE